MRVFFIIILFLCIFALGVVGIEQRVAMPRRLRKFINYLSPYKQLTLRAAKHEPATIYNPTLFYDTKNFEFENSRSHFIAMDTNIPVFRVSMFSNNLRGHEIGKPSIKQQQSFIRKDGLMSIPHMILFIKLERNKNYAIQSSIFITYLALTALFLSGVFDSNDEYESKQGFENLKVDVFN